MKKNILSSIICASLACTTVAAFAQNSLIIRVPIKQSLSSWSGAVPIYHPWMDVGSHYACVSWSPESNTINFGTQFIQSRDCSQDQQRDIEIREKDSFSGGIRTIRTDVENRTISESESQGSVGTYRDWRSTDSTFTEWADVGINYNFSSWSPAAVSQTASFNQTRSYERDQERFEQKREQDVVTGDIRNTGDPVKHEQTARRNESRSVLVEASPWSDVGGHYECDGWSPETDTVDVYEDFTQSRDCKQNQTRRWSYNADGSEIHSRMHNKVVTETESRDAVGTRRDWVEYHSAYTEWADFDSKHSYSAWTPAPSTQTANFTQTRDYKQPQEREEQKREIDTVSGETRNSGAPIRHTQDDGRLESRTVNVYWTAWLDTTRSGHSNWTPASYTESANFQQSRTYRQNQTRDRVYVAEGSELKRSAESRVVDAQNEYRTVNVTVNSWSNTDRDSHSSWSPTPTTQTTNFSQSRTYTQNQERTWTYQTGSSILDTRLETRGVTNQSENRAVNVSWSNWSVTKNDYSCDSWSPATNTKGHGESYTQTRSCKEDQGRTRYYKVGASTIGSAPEARTVNVTQSKSATGTGSWSAYTASCGSWSSTGNHSYGSWSPAHGSQTSNYSQSQSYKQNQRRTCQPRERDSISGTIRNTGSPYSETQTVNKSDSRTITVSGSGWSNTTKSGHSSYSPAAGTQTSNFTQTRTYTQNQKYTYTHKSGTSIVHTRDITRGLSGQSESRTVTATWSGWSFNKNHSYSGYSPSTSTVCSGISFTQTETYKRQEKRTISYSIGGTGPTGYRDLNKSRTRSATGTKSCGGNWNTGTLVYTTPSYYSNCPGVAYTDISNKGYSYTDKKSGSCTTLGATSNRVDLIYGATCQGRVYKQTCQ